jgi:hypothetical protein
MQAFTEQQFVHLLKLAQRKDRGQKSERDGGLIQPSLNGPDRQFDHRALSGSQRRMITHREPRVARPGRRRLMRNESYERNRDLGVARMPFPVAKRADLFRPDRWLTQSILGNADRRRLERLTRLGAAPWKRPSLAITRASSQQYAQFISHRGRQNNIDREESGSEKAFAHDDAN